MRHFSFYLVTALFTISLFQPIDHPGASTSLRRNHDSTAQTGAGLTPDFRNWLAANGYSAFDFARDDLPGGSYGGRLNGSDSVINQPVIFIHGNSDSALGTQSPFNGWEASIDYFLSQGYKTSELYATTWGPADPALAGSQYHSKPYLKKIRAFIQAVKAYTGAAKVDLIAHSMGVTMTRKAILGGEASDPMNGGAYELGPPLTPVSSIPFWESPAPIEGWSAVI
jgi:triacylglycerol lipase